MHLPPSFKPCHLISECVLAQTISRIMLDTCTFLLTFVDGIIWHPCLFSSWIELLFFYTSYTTEILLWLFFCSRLVFPVLAIYVSSTPPNLCWYFTFSINFILFKTLIFCTHHFIINFFPFNLKNLMFYYSIICIGTNSESMIWLLFFLIEIYQIGVTLSIGQ